MTCELDHLVVAARTLDEGVAWCEATLGVTPGPGGSHPLMGTHNRLLPLAGPDAGDGRGPGAFPRSYLEILAIDPDAPPPGRPRWFGLDEPARQARLARHGPQLIHAVLRSPDIARMRQGLIDQGLAPGTLVAASRGALRWRILLRDDGRIAADGALPTLIEWSDAHPTDTMADVGLRLAALQVRALPEAVAAVLRWRGPRFLPASAAACEPAAPTAGATPRLCAVLATPRGALTLASDDSPLT